MSPDRRTAPQSGAIRGPGQDTDTHSVPPPCDNPAEPVTLFDPQETRQSHWTDTLHRDPEPVRRMNEGQQVAAGAVNSGVRAKLDRAIRRRAESGTPFTSDDLHDDLDEDVLPHDGASMGAIVSAAARAGIIVEHGYVKSQRPEAHSRRIIQWVGSEVGR